MGHRHEEPVFNDARQGVEPDIGRLGVINALGETAVNNVIAIVGDEGLRRLLHTQGWFDSTLAEAITDQGPGKGHDLDRQRGLCAQFFDEF